MAGLENTAAGAMTMSPWGIAAGLGADVLSGLLAPKPRTSYDETRRAASAEMGHEQDNFFRLLAGGDAPDIQSLLRAFALQRQGLNRDYNSALRTSANATGAQAGAYGFRNPAAMMNYQRGLTTTQFAPQFGNLATQQATQHTLANRSYLEALANRRMALIGMGGEILDTPNYYDSNGNVIQKSVKWNERPEFSGYGKPIQNKTPYYLPQPVDWRV